MGKEETSLQPRLMERAERHGLRRTWKKRLPEHLFRTVLNRTAPGLSEAPTAE